MTLFASNNLYIRDDNQLSYVTIADKLTDYAVARFYYQSSVNGGILFDARANVELFIKAHEKAELDSGEDQATNQ